MNCNFNILILLISLAINFQLKAQGNIVSFKKILDEGYENSYNIKLEKFYLTKSYYTLLKANGYLNPFVNTNVVYGEGADPTFDNDGTKSILTNFVVPTKFGVDFYTGVKLERTSEVDETPNYIFNGSGAFAGVKIPLLKGLGKTNPGNSFIEVSKINQKAIEEQFSNEILIYFSELLTNYLTLNEVIEEYKIQENLVSQSKKYKEEIYLLADNDQIPISEKNRANSLLNNVVQELTVSMLNVFNVYYELKILLGVNDNKNFDSIPELMDYIPDPDKEKLIEYINIKKNNLDSLIKNTPQYRNISLGVDENEILLNTAKNQKKNSLDLDFKVSRFGSKINGAYNLNSTFNDDPGTSFLISLTHNLPIKNQTQKGAYLEQLIEYDLSKMSLQQYVYESNTSAMLNLFSLKQQINVFFQVKALVGLMKQNLLDEEEKFKLGSSTQIDVILSLNQYFTTLKSLNSAKHDVWKTYVNIKLTLGELPNNTNELNEFSLINFLN